MRETLIYKEKSYYKDIGQIVQIGKSILFFVKNIYLGLH